MKVPNESGSNGGPNGLAQHSSPSQYIKELMWSFSKDHAESSNHFSNPVLTPVSCTTSVVNQLVPFYIIPLLALSSQWEMKVQVSALS